MRSLILASLLISALQTTFVYGQTKSVVPQQVETPKANIVADSSKTVSDVVVNMEMIESFRRCYDKIEVVDWAEMLKGASAADVEDLNLAIRRMQTLEDCNKKKTLIAQVEKVKQVKSAKLDDKNLYTATTGKNSSEGSKL